jgi:hypothetical protein
MFIEDPPKEATMNKTMTGLTVTLLLVSSCTSVPTGPGADADIPEITVDGVLFDGEWDQATVFHFDANVPDGGMTPASVYLTNDDANLYVAVRLRREIADAGNSLGFEFDANGDNRISAWDDGFVVNPGARGLYDVVWVTSEQYLNCPVGAVCGPLDEKLGGTNDGDWSFENAGSFTVYEASHPLNSGDAYDFALSPGDVIGFQLFLRMIAADARYPEGYGDTRFPSAGFERVEIR